jgi:hypothetical protein
VRFFDQRIVLFSRSGVNVQWRIEPEDDDIALLELEVQRSESPAGPWKTLTTVSPLTSSVFKDKTVPFRPQNQDISYRLVAKTAATGVVFHEGVPFSLQGALPLDAIEIIRQHRILLEGLNGHESVRGLECTTYQRRHFGPRCRRCTDALSARVVISNCKECSGTGTVGGYFDPANVFMNINPYPKQVQLANVGKLEPSDTQVFMTNFPIMYPGDIIVEPSEKHWRVVRSEPTERKRTVVHQTLTVTQLKPDDITHETLLHSSHR